MWISSGLLLQCYRNPGQGDVVTDNEMNRPEWTDKRINKRMNSCKGHCEVKKKYKKSIPTTCLSCYRVITECLIYKRQLKKIRWNKRADGYITRIIVHEAITWEWDIIILTSWGMCPYCWPIKKNKIDINGINHISPLWHLWQPNLHNNVHNHVQYFK